MSEELRLAGYREPLGLWVRRAVRPEAYPELQVHNIEFTSRGDRVSGRLLLPGDRGGPFPLVLLQHGFGGSSASDYLVATGAPWAQRGVAVASIDFPLHGTRTDQKLLSVLAGTSDAIGGELRAALSFEFARQAVIDLERALDAAAILEWIDEERVVYAGFSLGAALGAAFCALDPRPCAAILALGGGGVGQAEIDPAQYVGRIAPRPLLFVGAERDATVPRRAADALFEAAGSPKQQLWFDASHDQLPGEALKAMWQFVAEQVGVPAG